MVDHNTSDMTTKKRCKVLKGSIDVPRLAVAGYSLEHRPLFGRSGHPVHFSQGYPGEVVTLPADEAIRLAAAGIVQIME
jgi:hypothetical protein